MRFGLAGTPLPLPRWVTRRLPVRWVTVRFTPTEVADIRAEAARWAKALRDNID